MLDQSTTNNAYFYEWLILHEQWTDVHYLETVAALYLETVWLGVPRLHAVFTKHHKAAPAHTSNTHFIFAHVHSKHITAASGYYPHARQAYNR